MSTILRATAVALSTGALALGLVAPVGAATPREARNAAGWLGAQLTGSVVHNEQYDFDDLGLSIDVALALDSLGRKPAAVLGVRDAVVARASEYVGTDPEQYAGATGKLLTLVVETGGDGTDAGGIDLRSRLEGLVVDEGASAGRIQDRSEFGDFANTIGQSFAVRGLAQSSSTEAASATAYLLSQQCADGYFRLALGAVDAEDPSCDAGDPATTSAPSTDATAFAVQALLSVPSPTPAVRAALADARTWLLDTQRGNGAFSSGGATDLPNSNSTGLGGAALGALGECRKAFLAAGWVKTLQVRKGDSDTGLAGEQGAIAYDVKALKAGKRKGITVQTQDQWRRATAQAAPVLGFIDKAACGQ